MLNLPSQPLDPGGDRLSYSEGKTFVGSRIGLYAQDAGGIGVGVSGIYDESSQVQALGGLVYTRASPSGGCKKKRRPAFRLRQVTFRGNGLRPELQHASWERILDLSDGNPSE